MNELNDTKPAPPGRAQGWTRWSQSVLESVFTTIAIGAIVVAVVDGIDTFTAETLERHVDPDDGVGAADPSRAGDYRLAVRSATLVVEDPTFFQRLATMLPVWLVARSLRDGDLFHPESAKLLGSSANIVLVGGVAAAAAQIDVSLWFVELADDLRIKFGPTGSLLALPVALALGGLAEIFRRGTALRDDVDGLV